MLSQGDGLLTNDKENGLSVNGEILFRSPDLLNAIGAPRPHIGASVATDEDSTSQFYAGLTWEKRFFRRYFVDGGFGVAVHDGETGPEEDSSNNSFLGCRALFRLSADAGYLFTERLSASAHFEHISNANLCNENEGLDNLGVRLGYRF